MAGWRASSSGSRGDSIPRIAREAGTGFIRLRGKPDRMMKTTQLGRI
jgi:hypothetical protein